MSMRTSAYARSFSFREMKNHDNVWLADSPHISFNVDCSTVYGIGWLQSSCEQLEGLSMESHDSGLEGICN